MPASSSAHDALTSKAALDHMSAFLNDTWSLGRTTINAGIRWDRYHGWLPEQQQLAASVGPVVLQAKTFPETHFYTWNEIAPRVGVTFDLTGDGKTVLKGNYGLYYHNPGVAVGQNANPNTPGKSETWSWNDVNGDRRWQAGENITRTAQALEGAIGIDPNIKAPSSHRGGRVDRASAHRHDGPPRRLRLQDRRRPDPVLHPRPRPQRLHRAVQLHRHRCGWTRGHGGRPHHPDARLPERAGGELPDQHGGDERAAVRRATRPSKCR